MPLAPSTPSLSTVQPLDRVATAVPALSFDALVKDPTTQPAAPLVSTAHQAVESALAIADQFTTDGQKSVNLQFSVSGVDLAVHVELRGDAVHTTFRTDSPELRTALAREWQAVTATGAAASTQRLAEPAFAPSATGSNTTNSSFTATDQRDPGARQQPASDQSGQPRSGPRASSTPAAPEPARATAQTNVASRFASAPAPGRLNAFA